MRQLRGDGREMAAADALHAQTGYELTPLLDGGLALQFVGRDERHGRRWGRRHISGNGE